MKKLLSFLTLTLTLGLGYAQIPTGYYNNASGKTGDALKVALHDIIKGHTVVSYAGLLVAYASTDCREDGKIWDMYSNYHYPLTGNCGSYQKEGDCWNREHTWPQSWFNEVSGPKSDLFHVYPTDGFVNGKRSSYPYGEVSNPTYTSGNGSKLGPCTTSGYSETVFEPIDEYKGDLARSYFYMSVRYYSEDSGWGSSDMTNKSVIKPWALAMLLRWSDNDPVSQKEIDRNNAVYGYQGNRNPFIDHPEYARMIWDPNYTPTNAYNITYASNLSHGSVSGPASAAEGSTVAIVATPDAGYKVSAYSVYKTGSPNTTVTVSSNGTFTMPGYAVTVSASFIQDNTYYTVTLGSVTHGSINANPLSARSGTNITLTASPASGYSLYAWYVYKTGDMNTTVTVSGNSFVMPSYNVTVMATFAQGSGTANGDYVKVTSAPSDWSGEYLIVCESQNNGVAFNGTVDNDWGRCSAVTINNHTIASSTTTDAYKVTVSKVGTTGYKFLLPSGNYMNWTGAKKFSEGTSAATYSISLSSGDVSITSNSNTLKYNYNNGSGGLRSYASGQTAIQLYKRTSVVVTPTHTIQFNRNGGSGTMSNQTVNEYEPTALNANTFTRANHVFDGWNTEADGSGTYYADQATVTLLNDLTLYAQWAPLYNITCATDLLHGSISASFSHAEEDATITLTATPESGYTLLRWVVTDAQDNMVSVNDNQFEMPASDVTVSAHFRFIGGAQTYYQLVTSADELVAGGSYLIVNTTSKKALGTTQNTNNRAAVTVTIENNDTRINTLPSTVCELTLGGTTGAWTFFDAGWGSSGGYLYAASSSDNYLRTKATNDANGKWNITIGTNGVATIQAQGTNSHNLLRYNSGSTLFSCYSTGQQVVCLFVRKENYSYSQNTSLVSGWNWWSSCVETEGVSLLQALKTALGTHGIKIQSEDDQELQYGNNAWSGDLTAIEAEKMYKVLVSSDVAMSIAGLATDPANHPITLHVGCNWVGYPLNEPLTLSLAFVNFIPAEGDKIVSFEDGMAIFENGVWNGTLLSLQPGKGYIYISTTENTLTF